MSSSPSPSTSPSTSKSPSRRVAIWYGVRPSVTTVKPAPPSRSSRPRAQPGAAEDGVDGTTRADQQVAVAVAVDITGGRDREPALGGEAMRAERRDAASADQDVLGPVAVDVTDVGDRLAGVALRGAQRHGRLAFHVRETYGGRLGRRLAGVVGRVDDDPVRAVAVVGGSIRQTPSRAARTARPSTVTSIERMPSASRAAGSTVSGVSPTVAPSAANSVPATPSRGGSAAAREARSPNRATTSTTRRTHPCLPTRRGV